MYKYIIVLVVIVLLLLLLFVENIKSQEFDIVIPVGENDISFINTQLEYTTQNIIGYRNIYIIVSEKYITSITNKNVIIINENIFPFTKNENSRSGWYFQQLLKMYAGFVIKDILPVYLVIDADTCFLKPIKFIKNNKYLFNYSSEYHQVYFKHMSKLHPSLYKKSKHSGICHHMIFDRYYIKKLFELVEKYHDKPFYQVFMSSIDPSEFNNSGASEYELYFNFMLIYYPNKIRLRELIWKNGNINENNNGFDYISNHYYIRN